jgi:vancomycin resistance protein YoaR
VRGLKVRRRALLLICGFIVMGGGVLFYIRRLPRQVVVAGITLPLDDRQQFDTALDMLEEHILETPLYIVADEQVWEVTGRSLGVRLDRVAMWESAQEQCPSGALLGRLRRVCLTDEPLRLLIDQSFVRDYLARLGALYWRAPQNATYDELGRIQPEKSGRVLNIDVTLERLLTALHYGTPTVVAQTQVITPAVTQAALLQLRAEHALASYTTYFDVTDVGRTANIVAATIMLDGFVLEPGATFSFNQVVGPRTIERGFHVAEEIINQELVPGVGGGVCQTSSTLYNAALLSGLEIVYRRPHSKPLGYVPTGRDATVYYDSIDLRFRNPYHFSIVIRAGVHYNALRITIFAPEPPAVRYDIVVAEVSELPFKAEFIASAEVPPGESIQVQAGQTGWVGRIFRVAYDAAGRELYREQISHDLYPAKPVIFKVHPNTYYPKDASAADGLLPL